MLTNQFIPFATGVGANVLTPSVYASLPAVTAGFRTGIAPSTQVNTALRQASFVAAMIAQFVCDKARVDVNDDGDLAELENNFVVALDNMIGNISPSTISITADTTLTADNSGRIIGVQTAGVTLTFPDVGIVSGGAYYLENNGSGNITLSSPISGEFVQNSIAHSHTIVMPSNSRAIYISDGANWIYFGGDLVVAAEATARSTADTNLSSLITAEYTRATGAEGSLSTKIGAVGGTDLQTQINNLAGVYPKPIAAGDSSGNGSLGWSVNTSGMTSGGTGSVTSPSIDLSNHAKYLIQVAGVSTDGGGSAWTPHSVATGTTSGFNIPQVLISGGSASSTAQTKFTWTVLQLTA